MIQITVQTPETSMHKTFLAILATAALATPAFASERMTLAMASPAAAVVPEEIAVAEWSLKHSSVARTIPASVLDNSLLLLARARTELAAGNARTAQELIRRANRPLIEMDSQASRGKHPDDLRHIQEMRSTLVSIIDAAERVAAEESAPAGFVAAARQSLQRADTLLADQKTEQARQLMAQVYLETQQRIAELRKGDAFYIAAPNTLTAADWDDGLRRIDERRQITGYLLLEARAEGIDIEPLQAGAREAEAAVAEGARLADARRWDQALQRLDIAYARYEESWRAVGIEW